ncbi:helix-turn-helix domain-containing protein [Mycobacterium europaeum]|uniref:helix-turn-helix domain-containing protein n=1 Tax=Mycobacterium europaeum TaxID=761804 RepID=UPI001B8016C5
MVRRDEEQWEPLDSLGKTGTTVAKNIRSIRQARGLAYTELAARLKSLQREIPTWGLRKIESGGRRVDADDLVALALALGVSPISLLLPGMPAVPDPDAKVEVTGVEHRVYLGELWNWLKADITRTPPSWANVSRPLFEANGVPAWEWARWSRGTDGDD